MALPAWKVAADLADGYLTLNPVVLKRYEAHELAALGAELERLSRETRAAVVPPDDADAAQKKNRKLLRLSQAQNVLSTAKSRFGR
jgi:hypothetical protein